MKVETASVFGLGKLGAPLAAILAMKGFRVLGVDADPAKVDVFNNGDAPVFEPGLSKAITAGKHLLRATTDPAVAVHGSDVSFVVVPTPSDDDARFSLRFVLPAMVSIAKALREKDRFHLVVLTSTVMPGATGGDILRALENGSGKRVGTDFGLCYSPEFVALGSVLRDLLHPDFVLIGESDSRSGSLLQGVYERVCESDPKIARMSFVNAELTKLAVNTFITTKISFANMLARICERLPGADVDIVTAALGLDSRIGSRYLKGAISYGGPCFPRDNLALASFALSLGAPADIAEATDRFNRRQVSWLADLIRTHLPENGTAGILGLTYKPDSDVVEEALGTLLAQELLDRGVSVVAYDPALSALPGLNTDSLLLRDAEGCLDLADVVVVATPWSDFSEIPTAWWGRNRRHIVIDCWRTLMHIQNADNVLYVPLGIGASNEQHIVG